MLVDRIQQYFACCGIMGPEDWITSSYNNHSSDQFDLGSFVSPPEQRMYRIPKSCCQEDQDSCLNRLENIRGRDIHNLKEIRGLSTEGCMTKFEEFIRKKQFFVILAGVVVVGVQILALIFSLCLVCAISRQEDK